MQKYLTLHKNQLSRLISISTMLLFLRWATGWHRAGSKGLQLWHWYCCKGAQHRKGAATALHYPLTVSNKGLQIHFSYYSLVIWRTDTRGSCLSQLSPMTAESSRIQTQQYWRRTEQPSVFRHQRHWGIQRRHAPSLTAPTAGERAKLRPPGRAGVPCLRAGVRQVTGSRRQHFSARWSLPHLGVVGLLTCQPVRIHRCSLFKSLWNELISHPFSSSLLKGKRQLNHRNVCPSA